MPNFSETFKDLPKKEILMVFKKTPYSPTQKKREEPFRNFQLRNLLLNMTKMIIRNGMMKSNHILKNLKSIMNLKIILTIFITKGVKVHI